MSTPLTRHVALLGAALLWGGGPARSAALPPTELAGLRSQTPFFPGAKYRHALPAAETILGFPPGRRAATPEQVTACLKAWAAAAPDRCRVVEYARSHEGRPLHYVIVTAPKNLERLDAIRSGLARLADPRKLPAEEADRLVAELPAVAWLAFTIHGDETEGSDAALALLRYLIDSDDARAQKLREQLVIIIDPLMNPDGRARFLKMVAEDRGVAPNVDDQSLLHRGYWPRGRGNHYLFDLNRDWILGVHPETRGRIRAVGRWNPVLFVDAHGMGAQDTHLFSPPREPINPNFPAAKHRWAALFARDQARAFDRQGLVYYTGEWNEEWYPGYSDAYASYRGAVGILYEQARIAADGVRRPGGRILNYHDSVRHHLIGALANLNTAAAHRAELLRSFLDTRRAAVAPDGPYGRRTFALLPTDHASRRDDFLRLMRLEGFELYESAKPIPVARATDQLGREQHDVTLPPGTILIPNRQPLAHLLAAMLEFDPRFSTNVLAMERKELLLKGRSKIYDTTAWNLTMFYGLPALELPTDLPEGTRPLLSGERAPAALAGNAERPVAYVIDGADDHSVAAAARLLEQGVQVRLADKAFELDGHSFARGSVVVTAIDNGAFPGDLRQTIARVAAELRLTAVGVGSGWGDGELPDLGGEHFRWLTPPRIALVGREESSAYDFGATWELLDRELALRHSHLDGLKGRDLSRYNVIILPGGSPELPKELRSWVRAGGTLIAVGAAVRPLCQPKGDWAETRLLPDVLDPDPLDAYELALFREWLGRQAPLSDPEAVWAHQAGTGLRYPWETLGGKRPEKAELERRDRWQKLFMPQGAFVAGRVDPEHWLTVGCGEWLPLLVGRAPLLMAKDTVQAPIRYGLYEPAAKAAPTKCAKKCGNECEDAREDGADEKTDTEKDDDVCRVGWAALPPHTALRLRMSGLLWPEAVQRLANAAWCTRERVGRGQIILFASPPAFRGTARAMSRVYLNAIVYGPGLGAALPIRP